MKTKDGDSTCQCLWEMDGKSCTSSIVYCCELRQQHLYLKGALALTLRWIRLLGQNAKRGGDSGEEPSSRERKWANLSS